MGGRQPYSHPSLPLFYYSSASSPPSLGMLMEDKIGHRGIGWCLAQWLMSSLTLRALLPTSSPFSSPKLPQPPPPPLNNHPHLLCLSAATDLHPHIPLIIIPQLTFPSLSHLPLFLLWRSSTPLFSLAIHWGHTKPSMKQLTVYPEKTRAQ